MPAHAGKRRRAGRGRPRGRRLWVVLLLLGVVLVLVAGALAWDAVGRRHGGGGAAGIDMNGRPVQLDPGAGLSTQQRRQQEARAYGAGRFMVPSVGLDVPLGTMNAVGGLVLPPGFTSAYRISNLGSPTAPKRGTVYVAMHSLRFGGLGPGNYLFDVQTSASKVQPGARIEAGGVTYVVDTTKIVAKSRLPGDAQIWRNVPGRLVVVTCLEKPDNTPATDNFIITAHLHAT